MKKIALDARMVRHSGIGTYLRGLLSGCAENRLPQDWDLTLMGPGSEDYPYNWKPFTSRIYSIEEQLAYPGKAKGYDLWHSPHYNIPFFKTGPKLVVTVHDLIHWIFRGKFFNQAQALYVKAMMERVVKTADRIIAVSEKTKQDLMEYFNAPAGKISVIYEGVSDDFQPAQDPAALKELRVRHNLPDRFFLYVGLMKPHKNILWLARLFRKLFHEKKISSPLVMIGKKDARYPSGHEELAALGREDAFIYLDKTIHGDLPKLYQSATALVHPSLYEGFGLTLLEAMASGTPVVAFRTASIPEVAGQAGVLLDINDEEQMSSALRMLESSSNFREDCSKKGLEQAARFKWRDTARKTLEVYREVLS